MMKAIQLDALVAACDDASLDDGIRIDTELESIAGPGEPVKPAVYEGGRYQEDRRWASPSDEEPTPIIVIDNVPSQANRLEDALRRQRDSIQIPELVLDLSELKNLPAHLPSRISSLQFPHRNADAYLRDALLGGKDFARTALGQSILAATPDECGPLVAWFPQALLYGFWQSHLGKKRHSTKHARTWVSEIVGWRPGSTETRAYGLKGDPLNLNTQEALTANLDDQLHWEIHTKRTKAVQGGKKVKLSEIGHGQVPFMKRDDAAAAAVSFSRVTQRATLSLAQLRRVALGRAHDKEADAAMRALLVSLGVHAHMLAFGRGFALRSGAALRPTRSKVTWLRGKLGGNEDIEINLGGPTQTKKLLREALDHASSMGVPLDGWRPTPLLLTPKPNLCKAIRATWPEVNS